MLVLPLVLGGCFHTWPEHGQGGMAESRPPNVVAGDMERSGLNAALDAEWAWLGQMRQRYGDRQAPAHLNEAELLAARISREIAGGLSGDAWADLRRLGQVKERITWILAEARLPSLQIADARDRQ